MPFSKRVENEYCVSLSTPLSVEIEPFPSLSPPSQTADALRFILSSCHVGFETISPANVNSIRLIRAATRACT